MDQKTLVCAQRTQDSRLLSLYRLSLDRSLAAVAAAALLLVGFASGRPAAAKPHPAPDALGRYLVYVGTYTDTATSKGIYAYRFNSSSGEIEPVGLAATTDDPSYLAADPSHRFLYAVNELNSYQGSTTGAVSAFSIDTETAMLAPLNQLPSRGARPAHIAVDRTGKYVIVSNFSSGSVAVFPILPDGRLGDSTAFDQHRGSGVNKDQQAGPHVRQAVFSPDNRFALVPDLGLDELIAYPFDATRGALGTPPSIAQLTPGFGPRHLVFSPDGQFIYLLSEMSSTITVLSYDRQSGRMDQREAVRIAPPDAQQKSGAEVQIDPQGKYLYASNGGTNILVVYSIDPYTGFLTQTETVGLPGKPQFSIDPTGRWLWDANADGNSVVLYRINAANGGLTPSGLSLKIASPACVAFVPIS